MGMKEKFIQLLDDIYELTDAGSLDWEEDSRSFDTAYKCTLSGGSIRITETTNNANEPLVVIDILREGVSIDSFNDETFRGMTPNISQYQNYFAYMSEIFLMAKRRSTRADITLNDILGELESRKIIG